MGSEEEEEEEEDEISSIERHLALRFHHLFEDLSLRTRYQCSYEDFSSQQVAKIMQRIPKISADPKLGEILLWQSLPILKTAMYTLNSMQHPSACNILVDPVAHLDEIVELYITDIQHGVPIMSRVIAAQATVQDRCSEDLPEDPCTRTDKVVMEETLMVAPFPAPPVQSFQSPATQGDPVEARTLEGCSFPPLCTPSSSSCS